MSYSLYPVKEPFNSGRLKVSNLHELYFEEVGNPKGKPVVFLHGGPGGGVSERYRQWFDPEHYRVVLFEQRGAGRSTPHAELRENTTWDLVEDTEKLRKHLSIKDWIVFGGSWGSTLALAYAQTHPQVVRGLCLRGIFLCRKQELVWFYQEGASRVWPDLWEPYRDAIPEGERGDFISAYHKRLTSEDRATRVKFARIWSTWEASTSKLIYDREFVQHYDEDEFALAFARIENHYFMNGAFLRSDAQLLEDAYKIRHIPTEIVQGRYDLVCPAESAWDLHKALPESKLHMIPTSGHSALEEGISAKLLEVMERFKGL